MIYPAFQKANISEWIDCTAADVTVSGYEKDYAEAKLNVQQCKGEKLYIDIKKVNTRTTEYIEEANRLTDEKFLINSSKDGDVLKLEVTVSGKKGLFRALNRISTMITDKKFFIGEVEDYPLFAARGYIEGFYGKLWANASRIEMLELMSFYGMNTYYYAPKDDPYHRDKWFELYPKKELKRLAEITEKCAENFVDFHYCIAPGLSMKYSSDEDFQKLACKAEQLYSIGVRNFGLLVDDIPENLWFDEDKAAFDGEAVNAHIVLANRFNAFLKEKDEKCKLTVCPLQYHGRGDEYYISKLGKGIDGNISLFWTGKNICSQEITVREAVVFENSTNRKPLYWDNFPVNDAEMQNEMHLGYISGRETDLYRYSEGIISNTMEFALSSKIPLLTVCDYLWNPVSYDGFKSWQKACEIILGEDKNALMPFFDNLLTSCLKVENSPMMNEALNVAQQKYFSGDLFGAVETVETYTDSLEKFKEFYMLKNREISMLSELKPWAEKQLIALDLLKACTGYMKEKKASDKAKIAKLIKKYLAHPKTLCDFSLQAFAERILTI